jgi:glycosyltransferase involved in cell wall biosynthesis
MKNKSFKKFLHIDASRLKSGGGVLHLLKLLELNKYSKFEKIVVHTYKNSEFEKINSNKIVIKTHPFIDKNILYQIFWQRFLLVKHISTHHLLFTIDSTSFCKFKKTVVLNQDIIGFQEGSYKYFSLKNKFISYLKYLVAKNAMKKSIANIFTTNYAVDEVIKKIGPIANSNVIPHGIDSEYLTKKINYKISKKSLKIVYVSSVLDYKNHKYLISALNNFPTDRKIKVYFVGGGDLNLIKKLKSQSFNKKGNEFNFPGFLDRKDVYSLTRNCDVAVFMSSIECFGITLLEYMKMGMPIICSNESSMPETLGDGGLLVSPSEEASIIEALKDFELNEDKRKFFGEKAYNSSIKYSWDNTVKRTYALLDKIYEDSNKNLKN